MDRDIILNMDVNILVSLVNMKLRDFYDSLEKFCEDNNITEDEIKSKLIEGGYNYNKESNSFK